MINRKNCPTCKKRAILSSQYDIEKMRFFKYQCGHIEGRPIMQTFTFADYVSSDGHKARQFQIDGANFGIRANARLLLADDMGIGKTIQTLMILKSHPKDLAPALWICKRGLIMQAYKEIMRWNGDDWIPQIIEAENQFVFPGKIYLCSYDMLWRFKDLDAFVKRLNIQTVCLDEVQHIKNSDSKRTQSVRAISDNVEHIIAMSGTPIKNHPLEYFPILNLLQPTKFPTLNFFKMRFLESTWDGKKMKYSGLSNPEDFKNYTSDFIIRRTKKEVLPELPLVSKEFLFCELGSDVENAYKDQVKGLQDYLNSDSTDTSFQKYSNTMAYMARMRHLTGIAKISACVEFAKDFAESTDRKLLIFIHHKDVGDKICELLNEAEINGNGKQQCIRLSAPIDQDEIDYFRGHDSARWAVISTLAGGEGLNLQFCSDMITLERQWNPANEQQVEDRICRIGQVQSHLTNTFIIAVGTIDEFFAELVEQKRSMMKSVLDGEKTKWNETDLIKELAEILRVKGGKQWGF